MSDWYPDPLRRADLRRHDGTRWTHDVITGEQQATEAVGLPLPRSTPGETPVIPPEVVATAPAPVAPPPPTYRAMSGPAPRASATGLLVAAGALGVVTGAVIAAGAIWMLRLLAGVNQLACNVTLPACGRFGGAYVLVIGFLIAGILWLIGGILACMGRRRGQSILIILGSLGVVGTVIDLVTGRGYGNFAVVPMIWFGLITGLALSGRSDPFA